MCILPNAVTLRLIDYRLGSVRARGAARDSGGRAAGRQGRRAHARQCCCASRRSCSVEAAGSSVTTLKRCTVHE
eukprot:4388608-Pleurochrysis_carterae.AAC.1